MNSRYSVKFSESAKAEFSKLDGSIKKLVLKQLIALETNPYKGKSLGNKFGMDLTGLYKLYVHKKQIRIVYEVIDNELVVYVLGIGKRDDLEVYAEVFNKLR
jgi:mRNA interferase RelE/StbE